MKPIRTWIYVASGFTADRNTRTGMETLWRKLRDKSGPGVCVQYRTWDAGRGGWDAEAKFIYRNADKLNGGPVIVYIGHSWAVGYGAVAFEKALESQGMHMRDLVSCDGVYWAPGLVRKLGAFMRENVGFLHRPTIQLPPKITRVLRFRQVEDRTYCGHALVPTGPTAMWPDNVLRGYDHQNIDDAPAFQAAAERAALNAIDGV